MIVWKCGAGRDGIIKIPGKVKNDIVLLRIVDKNTFLDTVNNRGITGFNPQYEKSTCLRWHQSKNRRIGKKWTMNNTKIWWKVLKVEVNEWDSCTIDLPL